jgi:hypothetical protein
MQRIPVVAALAVVLVAPLGAQQLPNRSWAIGAGPMTFDASGTGVAPVVTASAAQTLPWRWVAVEGALGYSPLGEQFGGDPTQLGLAEAQAQLQWPGSRVRPYLGFGGGLVHYFSNAAGRKASTPSVVVGAGVRTMLVGDWGFRLDGRVRGWEFAGATDWAVNTSAEVTAGISRRF